MTFLCRVDRHSDLCFPNTFRKSNISQTKTCPLLNSLGQLGQSAEFLRTIDYAYDKVGNRLNRTFEKCAVQTESGALQLTVVYCRVRGVGRGQLPDTR